MLLLIQNVYNYPPYLEAISYISSLRLFHAVMTRNLLLWSSYGPVTVDSLVEEMALPKARN
jgi:hypothetical protein